MTPPTTPPAETMNETFLGSIEIQTSQEIGITVPLGLAASLQTQHDQTVVVNTLNDSITVQDRTTMSSILESSLMLRTTAVGIDVVV